MYRRHFLSIVHSLKDIDCEYLPVNCLDPLIKAFTISITRGLVNRTVQISGLWLVTALQRTGVALRAGENVVGSKIT